VGQEQEVYVLCRSVRRKEKEAAMRRRVVLGLMRGLVKVRRQLRRGRIRKESRLQRILGRLQERYAVVWKYARVQTEGMKLHWHWDREQLRLAAQRDGAYLLRAHWTERDPERLWDSYIQLTEAEAAFRTLKSEVNIRPIWHWLEHRVEAHVMVAFLGYCLWVCLKHRLRALAPSLTPWQALDQLGRISLVEVWFELKDGRQLCLPRITQPELVQMALLEQLGWQLPEQPPPRVYAQQLPPEPPGSSLGCVADSEA
jgi:transposase